MGRKRTMRLKEEVSQEGNLKKTSAEHGGSKEKSTKARQMGIKAKKEKAASPGYKGLVNEEGHSATLRLV